jgi:hypothetical protein
MGKLEVVFCLGMAHPLLIMDNISRCASVHFPETGNTVHFEVREGARVSEEGAFDTVLLVVERKCDPGDREAAQTYAKLKEWGVVRDAATVLGRVLAFIRDEDFLRSQVVGNYPAVVSESPQSNPAVQTARADVFLDGQTVTTMALTGFPSIGIGPGVWDRVCERLERREDVPAHRSFLLDAYYFATSGDPLRAVVMACAAWDTALRQFLLSKGLKFSRRDGVHSLRVIAETTKGTFLLRPFTDALAQLTLTRNKLLHEGKKDMATEDVVEMILAVDESIIWLFGP